MTQAMGRSNIFPAMPYRDAAAAIEFLCRAFGFERQLVVPGEDGGIAHAQLRLGNGMIMLGTAQEGAHPVMLPADLGGNSRSVYIVVPEIDAHYQRACAEGAEILLELADQDYGGRLYSARDPEGHLWDFGSYDPWAQPPA